MGEGWYRGPYQGQPYQGQPYQGSPYPGQAYQGSPYPGQAYQGSPYPGQAYPDGSYPGAQPGGRPPRGRGRRVALLVVALVVVAGLVVLALLAFVTGPRFARVDVLDPAAVERGVTDVVTQDWKRTVNGVDCPAGVRVRAGESFRCTATVDGRPRQVPVDVLDDQGTYQVGQPR